MRTRTFDEWFSARHGEVVFKLNMLHLDVLCSTDFSPYLCNNNDDDGQRLTDVQMVDLVMKLCDKMVGRIV
jgi:hypothetical protein